MMRFLAAIVLWVGTLPALPALAATEIKEFTSPGGIEVWLVEEPSIPIVALEVSFKGGTSLDLPGKEGSTYLMAGLLEEGAGDLNATEFLEETEALAAAFSYRAYRDTMSIEAEMLKENVSEAIDLLRLALIEPTFDQVALDRVRGQVLSSLSSDTTDPDEIASKQLRALSFPGHPYGSRDEGTIEIVSELTRDDIVTAHRNAMVKSRMYVGAVGDITAEELGPLVDRLLGDLPEDGPALPEKTEMAIGGGTTIVELDTPQSVALFAHSGIAREDPDFFAAYLLNEILGGSGLESRLMKEVREKRGLTYGVYSFLAPYNHAHQMMGSVASSNASIAEAIRVIKDEWTSLAEKGVTAQELEDAKRYVTGAYPLRFDSNAKIAGILVGLQLVGLPSEYIKTRNAQMEAVTLEDVNAMAKRLLRPDDLRFVVVGKPDGLKATD